MKPTSEILKRMECNSQTHKDGIYTRLYRYLLREDIYMTAYQKLYRNKGAGTEGIDKDTADGFGEEYVHRLIKELKNLTYEPKPVRRVYIAKSNGKKRPLGVPSFRDKLVQEAIRQILEAIYEPIFSKHSHGFRANRSCHTALAEVGNSFRGTIWFVEGDIKGCFDNINHKVLLETLSEKIKDSKFINLIRKFLKAGYMEDWKYHRNYSGTPQGGILSPILANIYLNELDKKVKAMQEKFNAPCKRDRSPAYKHTGYEINKLKKRYGPSRNDAEKKALLKEIHKLGVELRKLPSKDATDKKIAYVRYADDFIIGVTGTREEAEQIKEELTRFLAERLKLELSHEKTKITHSSEKILFLGYEISVRRSSITKPTQSGIRRRTMNYSVNLAVPLRRIEKFLFEHKAVEQSQEGTLTPVHREYLIGSTDLEIIDTYNAQTRGICDYYSLASNYSKLGYFVYLMEYSCLKTFAKKYKTHIRAFIRKHRVGKKWGIEYETKKGTQRMMIVKLSDIKRGSIFENADVDAIKDRHYYSDINSLEKRLKAHKCELCGAEGKNVSFEIHHINKLKNLKGKTSWEKTMIAKKRKTLVVCHECHVKIHHS